MSKEAVDDTGAVSQERISKVGYHDHGHQIRKQQEGLIDLFCCFFADLIEEDCDRYAKHGIQDDKSEIIQDGVPCDDESIPGGKQIFEIAQACPGTPEDPLGIIEFLKRNDQTVERHIVINKEIEKPWQTHKKNGEPASVIRLFLRCHIDGPSETLVSTC